LSETKGFEPFQSLDACFNTDKDFKNENK